MDTEEAVRRIVSRLVTEYTQERSVRKTGVFGTVNEAAAAAGEAHRELMGLTLNRRKEIIESMRRAAVDHAQVFSQMAVEETGIGRCEDKVVKNILAAQATPGPEDLEPGAFTNEHGMTLVERAPYGVIGAVIPVTNPTATVINNGISMVSGGNAVVFHPHPSAKGVSNYAVSVLGEAVKQAGGPEHLLTSVERPTLESAGELMRHPEVSLVVVTGGPGVVRAAMNSGKKVIAAGPGNPPCVVDETAHIKKAGKDIVSGAGFDHNLVCICEKEVLVVDSVADGLMEAMRETGGYLLGREEAEAVTRLVLEEYGEPGKEGVIRKAYAGKSPEHIAGSAGVTVPKETRLLFFEAGEDHPLVWTEQLMPVLPVVRLKDADACIDLAVRCEHGYRHTAVMHSLHVEHLSRMAKLMNCSLFVKNGPCYAGLGHGGAGFTSFTIASPTGEGLTRARTFTRERRCTLVDYFRIV